MLRFADAAGVVIAVCAEAAGVAIAFAPPAVATSFEEGVSAVLALDAAAAAAAEVPLLPPTALPAVGPGVLEAAFFLLVARGTDALIFRLLNFARCELW